MDLAIAAFSEGARGAPDQLEPFIRSNPGMRAYETVMVLDSSLGKNAENVGELTRRSAVLRQLGHLRRAEADSRHGVQLLEVKLQALPGNVTALRQRTMLNFAANRWPETVADSNHLLASRPKDVPILRRRAIAAAHLGDWQQAQEDHGRIRALVPNDAYILHLRCCASFELGQADEVASDMRRVREVVGQNAALASSAIWLFLERQDAQRFPEDALWCAERAIELDPRADLRIALGGTYCQLGRDREAVDTLAPAADGAPGSAAALREFWLAVSWHRLGDGEKAQEAYRRALRRWKSAGAISASRDDLLQKTWQEAKSHLSGTEGAPPRS
jgi:tetratricopeptide (TPR) repeat protein